MIKTGGPNPIGFRSTGSKSIGGDWIQGIIKQPGYYKTNKSKRGHHVIGLESFRFKSIGLEGVRIHNIRVKCYIGGLLVRNI